MRNYFTEDGTRADLGKVVPRYQTGFHLYTCGSARYMDAIFAEGEAKGWPDEARHKEYFTVPESPDYVNEPFVLKLTKSGRKFDVPADKRATDVLLEAGIAVDMKCSDGICGVCAAPIVSGEVEHRDHVLSKKERESKIILSFSRAKTSGGEIAVDL